MTVTFARMGRTVLHRPGRAGSLPPGQESGAVGLITRNTKSAIRRK